MKCVKARMDYFMLNINIGYLILEDVAFNKVLETALFTEFQPELSKFILPAGLDHSST